MTELQKQLADAHEHMEAAKKSGDFDAEYFWGQEHYRILHLRQKEMYAEKYPPVQFERVPDEGLLE